MYKCASYMYEVNLAVDGMPANYNEISRLLVCRIPSSLTLT
jgi:hypothetical protein